MTLPLSLSRYHTAWVSCAECRPRPVRYTVDGDRIVCFGDELPRDAVNGCRVFITVHEIAGGQPVAQLTGSLRDVAAGRGRTERAARPAGTRIRSVAIPMRSQPPSHGTRTAVS